MIDRPKVSVIITTHNNVDTIEECIDSIWSRTFSEIEVIVVDENSTDGTKDLLSELSAEDHQITYLADSMGSMGHARNIGMDHARAPYIIFADPEGYFSRDAVEYMFLELDDSPNADMFTCETDCFGSDSLGRTCEDRRTSIGDAYRKDNRKQEMESRLIRSWMFDNITLYRESYLYDKGIRFYEKPGYGNQDDAFRFMAMASGIASISVDVKYHQRIDLSGQQITDTTVVTDVCDEFKYLKAQLQKDSKLWWKMRLVYWQAYYDRNMQLYEKLSDDLKARLSKKLQADIKEAIFRKEFSRDHFDIRVRDEMELLMKSTDEFDRFQAKKIIEREKARDNAVQIDDRLTEIIVSEEEDELERLSRESAEKAEKLRMENRLNREWLMDEMSRDLASLRLLLGMTTDEMSNLLGVSGNTYKSLESGKKEISWDQYMALLFVFHYNDRTSPVTDTLGLFPEPLKVRMKKGTSSIYG